MARLTKRAKAPTPEIPHVPVPGLIKGQTYRRTPGDYPDVVYVEGVVPTDPNAGLAGWFMEVVNKRWHVYLASDVEEVDGTGRTSSEVCPCGKDLNSRGLCRGHYTKARRLVNEHDQSWSDAIKEVLTKEGLLDG